jgi:hypothetical protein
MNIFSKNTAMALLLSMAFLGGCAKEEPGIVNVCVPPTVIRTSPSDGGTNVPLLKASAAAVGMADMAGMAGVKVISATFSVPMNPRTISPATFTVMQASDTIRGAVSYSDTTAYFMLPDGLQPNLTYTCRITAGARDLAGTALATDYVWTFKSIAPGTPTLASPANGAVNQSLNPILAWNAVPGAGTYRLQISLSPAFVSAVYDDSLRTGTSQQLSGLVSGTTYFWRVNAKISGATGAYSDIWKFTTIVTPPAPALVAPLAGAANQPTIQAFSWLPSAGAETYRLQISQSPVFAGALFYDSTVVGTTQLINGFAAGTTYYWRMSARNGAGTSAFSTRSFTTVIAAPLAPAQVAPIDGSADDSTIQTLDWNPAATASTYRLQVDTSSSFAGPVFDDSTLTASSGTVPGLKVGETYYWRVNARNIGGASAYSATWRFTVTTVAVLKAPLLSSPADSAAGISTHPLLDWDHVIGADTYRLQVDTTAAFAGPVYDSSAVTATALPMTGLLVGKTYFWRVNATYTGGTSAFSAVRRFTVALVTVPQPPVLIAPLDSAGKIPRNVDMSWNASAGASSYRLQVDTSAAFTAPLLDDSTVTGLVRPLAGLKGGTTYFWRVSAQNGEGASAYTASRRFTVDTLALNFVDLGMAAHFGSIGSGAGITNQGILTQINGSIGTTGASTLVTGFHDGTNPPTNVFSETPLNIGSVSDTIYTATAPPGSVPGKVATDALAAAQSAFNFLKGLPPGADPGAGELGGQTLAPGTYTSAGGTFKITLLDLTLDGQGDPDARFVFQVPSSLTVGSAGPLGARSVNLINGAQAKNVFWAVGTGGSGSATINGAGGGTMVGTIIAASGVSFSTVGNIVPTRLEGRALSLNASVTLVNTLINVPSP